MLKTVPNLLTLLRLGMVPFIALLYLIGVPGLWLAVVFLLTSVTDLLDGFLARRLNQVSRFGAFLDPVADKLMIAVVLVLLISDRVVLDQVISSSFFSVVAAIILGREIAISALREWMSEIGSRARVAVSGVGKVKTTFQMLAVTFLLYREDLGVIPVFKVGEFMLYLAGLLTLWSMALYIRAAWSELQESGRD
jgi:CDP-diacylglycerol--glycerol-3-phosphate 3-phosphatidyltransferase